MSALFDAMSVDLASSACWHVRQAMGILPLLCLVKYTPLTVDRSKCLHGERRDSRYRVTVRRTIVIPEGYY